MSTNTRHIRALLDAQRRLLAEHRDLPVTVAATLLGVAVWEDHVDSAGERMSLEDLAARIGTAPSSLSQHMRYLGERYRFEKPGLGFVQTYEHPSSGRKKTFHLTPRGRGLIRQLDLILRKAD
ncbi:hypothetical protein K32_42200 [Kaistia sp. 32K]|uniref:hypothetical protein n=1 Tax=Kaistia sp. 32K TaxID=2795690 RepID=UPI001914E011|nr:hypothetical protein [Kaistia sp. 32K]BCP55603.1 hypothetical protein K32_42200 [Kaistia sp. 32K]